MKKMIEWWFLKAQIYKWLLQALDEQQKLKPQWKWNMKWGKKRQTRKKNNLYWQTFNNAGNKYFEHTFILNIKIIVNCYKYHSLVDNSALHSYPLIKRKEGLTYS